jgi:hypothetical protein
MTPTQEVRAFCVNTALAIAQNKLARGDITSAEDIVADAAKIEAYLLGSETK